METLEDGSLRERPPEHCTKCESVDLRPGWEKCPDCGVWARGYRCPADDVTMASWHVHRGNDEARPG